MLTVDSISIFQSLEKGLFQREIVEEGNFTTMIGDETI